MQAELWGAFLVHRLGRALREVNRWEEAERWLLRLEQNVWIMPESMVSKRRAMWDLALCRDAQGDVDGAIEYLNRFLRYWHTPDTAFPEIQEAPRHVRGDLREARTILIKRNAKPGRRVATSVVLGGSSPLAEHLATVRIHLLERTQSETQDTLLNGGGSRIRGQRCWRSPTSSGAP